MTGPSARRPLFIAAAAIGALGTLGVLALENRVAEADGTPFSAAQEEEIKSLVREYILENPGIVMEAVQILRRREAQAGQARAKAMIASHFDALAHDGISPVIGPEDAPVTVIEFYDYRCPYCKRAYADVARLLDEHEGEIRYVFKQFPVLDRPGGAQVSHAAARAAVAAERQGRFEAYHARLMTARGQLTEDRLFDIAQTVGLDMARFSKDMNDPKIEAYIEDTVQLGQTLGITGTPTYIVNGRLLAGAQGYDALAALVEEEEEDGDAPAGGGR